VPRRVLEQAQLALDQLGDLHDLGCIVLFHRSAA
jgi:hypothetical protein